MYAGERFNGISHLIGAALAVAGTALLIGLAARVGDPWKIVSFSVYGAMLIALYLFSTLYHSVRGPWGWSLFGAVWALALLGIVQEIWLAKGRRGLSLAIYLLMGWLALVAVVPLWVALSPVGFAWLAAGGALYTAGIAFYATDQKLRHGHGVWHLFVLAGSACHFCAVLFYVA